MDFEEVRYLPRELILLGYEFSWLLLLMACALSSSASASDLVIPLVSQFALISFLMKFSQTTRIGGGVLRVAYRYGRAREVALSEIVTARLVPAPRPRGAFGMRRIFPSHRIWSSGGAQAVQCDLADGRQIYVGTEKPEALVAAVSALEAANRH